MAARFTEHPGDPAWLKSQREAQARVRPVPISKPIRLTAPVLQQSKADLHEFVQGARNNSGAAFVFGVIAGAVIARGRR